MIGVSRYRDPAIIALLERVGLNPKKYIAVKNKETYLEALNRYTGEIVRISKADASIM